MASNISVKTQQTTIGASTAETTIVTANPNTRTRLAGLVITTLNAAASTLTLRSATGGTARMILDFPSTAAVPVAPLVLNFSPALEQREGINNNWTLQASVSATGFKITALYQDAE